jgi:cytochrome c556
MRVPILVTASALLVSACGQSSEEKSNQSASTSELAATATAAATAGPLGKAVSGVEAKKAMHERHEGMEAIGDAMKLVSGELKKGSPDLAKVRSGAATFARYAPQVKGWYPPGTGPDVGKTRAKVEIWQKPEDFRSKAGQFEKAAQAFNAAARGTDLAAIRTAHADLGKACKACHELYRAPEE